MQASLRRIANPLSVPGDLAPFHSTAVSLAKWKYKWDFCEDEESTRIPSKTYIRYSVRQKRADAKRALKNFLYGKPSKLHSQDEDFGRHTDKKSCRNSGKYKSDNSSSSRKPSGTKRSRNKYSFIYDADYEPREPNFNGTFGGHRGFTWDFSSGFEWKDEARWERTQRRAWNESDTWDFSSGFEWKDEPRWERTQRRAWNESDAEDDSMDIVSHSHRRTLGLSCTGPLTLDDVKCAFRASALKWHPDKHQGASQAIAGERFKLCVNAYNALCDALKSNNGH